MVQLQNSILKHLHQHTLSNVLFDGTYEAHHVWILSCYGLNIGIWLIAQPIFLAFQLFSSIFCTTLCTWGILLFTQTSWCVFTWLCQCHLELEGDRRPSFFYLCHISSSKSFDHITKDANIFHLKLGGNYWLSYSLTSTPSKHTSHHHGQFITSHWFLTYKYGWPSTSCRLWTWRDFITTLK